MDTVFDSIKKVVAPYIGAWIEIDRLEGKGQKGYVAPYIGAWIVIKLKKLKEKFKRIYL